MPLTVAIVGRPNVGKSTLFNRLARKKLAIVHDLPGVTRDTQEAHVEFGNTILRLIDTAGYDDEGTPGSLSARMLDQTMAAVGRSDLCVLLIDGREGVTASDEMIGMALRRTGRPVILVANKCEASRTVNLADAHRLGFGEPVEISAVHGLGLSEFFDAIAPFAEGQENPLEEEEAAADRAVKLAIIGRPNVGKSSLFNRLVGEERALTGPEPGITRDAIAAEWSIDGRKMLLHDTAGLRKRAKTAGQTIEQLAVASTLAALQFAECVLMIVDATAPFERQDLTIADLVEREGRATVFVANKWDLAGNRAGGIGRLRRSRDELLPQWQGAPLVVISALTGEGIDRIFPAALVASAAWNRHVPTARLNRFLADALEKNPPPAVRGRRVRVRYMTQPKARPPTFALFGTQLNSLPETWLRYLRNELRSTFDFGGAPIRFLLRTSSNPFSEK